jgi:hypothetical protein
MTHLEAYRRSVEGFNNRELSEIAATLDENVVAHLVDSWPEQVLVGSAAYIKWTQELLDSVGGEVHVKDAQQIGETVAAHFSVQMYGQASAIEEEREYGQLSVYHRGKCVLILFFDSYADALACVGATQR